MEVVGVLNPTHVLILFILVLADARSPIANGNPGSIRDVRSAQNSVKNQDFTELYQKLDKSSNSDQEALENTENPSLSKEELEIIRKRILDGLGLVSTPKRNMTNITEEEFAEAYSEYLRAVEEEEMKNQDFEDYVDTESPISSFRFYSNKITGQIKGRGRRNVKEWQKIVHFQVQIPITGGTNGSRVVKASSKFYKKRTRMSNLSIKTIPVSFYRLDNIPRGKFKELNLSPIFLETQNVSIFDDEWIEIDMKNTVTSWLKQDAGDTGILIKCPDCDQAGVRFVTGSPRKDSNKGKVPRLDVQTEIIGVRRVKRSRKIRKLRKRGRHPDCVDDVPGNRKKPNRCCRRSMQVRFSDFSEFDFIISPTEFDAYYCSGRCPARYNPANEHALLQAFVKLRERNIPGPCCAPTELKGMPILHIGKDGRLKTSYWSDVIVTKCECT